MVLTIAQTQKLLKIGRSTVYRMFERGELERVEFGRPVRIKYTKILTEPYKEQIYALI